MSERKHTPESVLGLARSFMEARVVLSAAELNLFTLLAGEARSAEDVAGEIEGDLRAATVLLDVLAALGFLEKTDGRYRCPEDLARFLSAGAPNSVRPMVMHAATLWRTWSNLTAIVRGQHTPEAAGERRRFDPEDQKAFIGAMHVAAARTAPSVVQAIDPGPAKALLDVGGGSGSYTLAFLKASPDLKATLFDLPPVIEMARQRITEAGEMDRVRLAPGNFYKDELPGGHDLALLSAIIHQNSYEQNVALYEKVYRALNPGGRIIVRDHVMSADRTEPLEGAMFAVNMLVGTPGGGTYTFGEIEEGLTRAGFTRIRQLQSRGMFSLVEGFKP